MRYLRSLLLSFFVLFFGTTACLTNPAAYKVQKDRDILAYEAPKQLEASETKSTIAIVVHSLSSIEDESLVTKFREMLEVNLKASVADVETLKLVERENLSTLITEQAILSKNPLQLPGVDILLCAKIVLATPHTLGVDFRLYDVSSKELLLSYPFDSIRNREKNSTSIVEELGVGRTVDDRIAKLTVSASNYLCLELYKRYARPASVIELRGKAKVALLNQGQHVGYIVGNEVRFYERMDKSAYGGAVDDEFVVGDGLIIESSKDRAWVKLKNGRHDDGVKLGTFARLSERK